jgi:ribokinase
MSILVIGNVVLDRSFLVDRLPYPGETMIARDSRVDCGGKGLNQAVAAARAGATVTLHAMVGDDEPGRKILAALREEQMVLPANPIRCGPTDEATVLLLPGGENSIICSTHAAAHIDLQSGLTALEHFGSDDWLISQGNTDRATTEDTLLCARRRNVRTIVNPSPPLFDYTGLWPMIDILILNAGEARTLGGHDDFDLAAARMLGFGCHKIVITLGPDGARIYGSDQQGHCSVAAPVMKIADTTGAGDTCCGVMAAGLDAGLDLESAVAWGVRCATLKATRWGSLSALPSREEINRLR